MLPIFTRLHASARFWGTGGSAPWRKGGFDPKNLPLGLMCYRTKFGSSSTAAMLPQAESSTANFVPLMPLFCSDVTISKFRFSIDFDSIFSPKSWVRFDLILVTPMLNHSRQNKIPWQQTPGGRLQSDLLPLQNRPAFANWCELARYVSADNSLPVTSDQSPTHLAFADVKVTGDNHVPTVAFIADHPSATFRETWCVALTEAVIAG